MFIRLTTCYECASITHSSVNFAIQTGEESLQLVVVAAGVVDVVVVVASVVVVDVVVVVASVVDVDVVVAGVVDVVVAGVGDSPEVLQA